jgi:uncharacterized membrane protein YciS (DUF1049 family)
MKPILKTVFLIFILALLVLMGVNNRQVVEFSLPPLLTKTKAAAAVMYFCFFAAGVLSGTLLNFGGGKRGSSGKSSEKSSKS